MSLFLFNGHGLIIHPFKKELKICQSYFVNILKNSEFPEHDLTCLFSFLIWVFHKIVRVTILTRLRSMMTHLFCIIALS